MNNNTPEETFRKLKREPDFRKVQRAVWEWTAAKIRGEVVPKRSTIWQEFSWTHKDYQAEESRRNNRRPTL